MGLFLHKIFCRKDVYKMTLANNIIKFRKENNFTQEDLGKELGISRQSISKWENGGFT